MEIKDVELATGLSEDTIHFYESEGLIIVKKIVIQIGNIMKRILNS